MRNIPIFSGLILLLISLPSGATGAPYRNVDQVLTEIDLSDYQLDNKTQNSYWGCSTQRAVEFPEALMERFFLAAARDRLTVIRLFGVLAKHLHGSGYGLCGSGDVLNRVIERNRIYLGLSLPLNNLAVYTWLPQYDQKDPDRLMRLSLIYRKQFLHRFEETVLPADLKMGFDSPIDFEDNGEKITGFLTEMDFYVSAKRVGFDRLRGIGARPHGLLGKVMDVLSFIPDSVHSMYLEDNVLATEALITTKLPNFETTPLYQIRVLGNAAYSRTKAM